MTSLSLATRAMWSLKAFKSPLASSAPSFLTSQRLIHTTRSAFSEDKVTEAAAGAVEGEGAAEGTGEAGATTVTTKLPHRRRKFQQWLETEGTRWATPSFSGPNFVTEVVSIPLVGLLQHQWRQHLLPVVPRYFLPAIAAVMA